MRYLATIAAVALAFVSGALVNAAPASAALGPARWEHPAICVANLTGPRWSAATDDAVRNYGTHARLRMVYRDGKGSCAGWDQIIRIVAWRGGKNGVPGYAWLSWSGKFFTTVQTVHLNVFYGRATTWRERLHIVNHEVGHAVGLDHNNRNDSVMGGPEQVWLSHYDREELHRRYS